MDRDLEQLHTALNSVKVLRSNVGHVFDTLSSGLRADHGEDGKENKFMLELQEVLTTVNNNLRDLETSVSNLTPPPGPFNLANTTYLSQETTQERQALYGQLVNSYKWTDKIREYSTLAGNILATNSVNKTYKTFSTTKRRKTQTSNHNVPPEVIENLITGIDRLFPDVAITAPRPFAPNPIIQASLGRVLKSIIAFKGLMIEWVVVKAHSESNDLWTESRHKVFRKVTEHCHAAMCHFHSPTMPELAVRSFMHWFHSYNTLFSSPCKRCGNHLHNNLPPTWRDLRTLEPYHEELIRNWSEEEKLQLLRALEKYGTVHVDLIANDIPTKTEEEVKQAIATCERLAMKSIQTQKRRHNSRKAPIDNWLNILKGNSDASRDIATALKFISLYEKHTDTVDINLSDCYEYLSNIMTGKLAKQIDSSSQHFLMTCFARLCIMISQEDITKQKRFLDNLNFADVTRKTYTNKKASTSSDPKLNVLKVPAHLLKTHKEL